MKKFTFEFKRDINGNKYLSVKIKSHRAFPIQTMGNLPVAHKVHWGILTAQDVTDIKKEVKDYVLNFGTKNQKNIIKDLEI